MNTTTNPIVWQRTGEAVRRFISTYGHASPRRAIICTYDLDLDCMEQQLLPLLDRATRGFNTLVLADRGALSSQPLAGQRRFGRVQVAPVICRAGVFHPKLFFLRAGPHVLVGVGSANLTRGGFGGNLELMLFEANDNPAGAALTSGAAHFLARLVDHKGVKVPASAIDFIQAAMQDLAGPSQGAAKSPLLHSLDMPLLEQMAGATQRSKPKRVDIVSPWHSAGESVDGLDSRILGHIGRCFAGAAITVHTEGQGGKAPRLGSGAGVKVLGNAEPIDEDASNSGGEPSARHVPSKLHAKAYILSGGGAAHMYFGSANCTIPALKGVAGKGGNVELLVGTVLDKRALGAWHAQLNDLFRDPTGTVAVERPKRQAAASGAVLSGVVSGGPQARILTLELANERKTVILAPQPDGRGITVPCDRLVTTVPQKLLHKLLPADWFDDDGGLGGGFLYEKVEGEKWAPFPVSLPLAGTAADGPLEGLRNLILEELGMWRPPVRKPKQGTAGPGEDDTKDGPGDIDQAAIKDAVELTLVQHQAKLDQLATMMRLLQKRLAAPANGNAYTVTRTRLFIEQLQRFGLEPHLLTVVGDFLGAAAPGAQQTVGKA